MRTFLLAVGLVLSACLSCPLHLCNSTLTVQLSADQRAVLDEGESQVQLCVDAACTDFLIAAGGRAAQGTNDTNAQVDRVDSGLLFTSRLLGEGPRDVTLVISREGSERLNRSWPGTTFSFKSDQSDVCAQSCVQTNVSAE